MDNGHEQINPPANNNLAAFVLIGVGLLIGLIAGALIFFGLPNGTATPAVAGGPTATPAPAPILGAPAPAFTLQTLAGQTVSLADYQGKVVLLNFWATWCGPCEAEMPAIQKRYDALKDRGFEVLAINLAEDPKDVTAFIERLGLSFTILLDPQEEVFDRYRIIGYPTSYIIGRDGIIVAVQAGYMTEKQLDSHLALAGLTTP